MRVAASLRFSIVRLTLSTARNISSTPRRNCSTVRMPPAIGAASRLITSAKGSLPGLFAHDPETTSRAGALRRRSRSSWSGAPSWSSCDVVVGGTVVVVVVGGGVVGGRCRRRFGGGRSWWSAAVSSSWSWWSSSSWWWWSWSAAGSGGTPSRSPSGGSDRAAGTRREACCGRCSKPPRAPIRSLSRYGSRWAWYVFISGSLPRGCEPGVVDGCPRSPRIVGDVDHEVLAPVPVDLGRRHPLAVDMKRGCIGFSAKKRDEIGTASMRFGDQPSAVRYSGRRRTAVQRHACQEHLGGRVRSVPEPSLADHVLLERVAEQVRVRLVAGDRVAVDRRHAGVRGGHERSARQRRLRRTPRCTARFGCQPSPSAGSGSTGSLTISTQNTQLARCPSRRPSASTTSSAHVAAAVAGLERVGLVGGSSMQQREAVARPAAAPRCARSEPCSSVATVPPWSMKVSWNSHRYRLSPSA